ncbi:BCD1 [Candida theae]|uniref:BCD1 n=1 Tax=Candida theae TaxID=1198502 RepID=A0AAD5BG39_9ASCO|nr:BCD1 [Candida theae]KAI5960885.1 BCD1 [Candida theae]
MDTPTGDCKICQQNQAKYTCPACNTKTCSLTCYKTHKDRDSCTGKVDTTKFIQKSELTDNPTHLNRDYNYLLNVDRSIHLSKEDIKQKARNILKRSKQESRPDRKRFRSNEAENDKRRLRVSQIFTQNPTVVVKRDNTMIIQVAPGMQRALSNKTGYDKKSNAFTWTVEWILLDQTGSAEIFKFLSYRLNESLSLNKAVPLNVLKNHGLTEVDSLTFYLRNVTNTPPNSVIELDNEQSISSVLKDKIVIEYPTIYVSANKETMASRVVDAAQAYEPESIPSDSGSSDSSPDSSSESSSGEESSDDDDDDNCESDSDSDSGPEESSAKPSVVNGTSSDKIPGENTAVNDI